MTATEPTRGKPRLVGALIVIALVVFAIDQLSKFYAVERLTPRVVVPIIGDYLGWQLIFNPGAAFSMATGMTWVLTIVAAVVVVVVLRVARKLRSKSWAVALGLLLGGALGNLTDRLVRDPGFAQGHVVDFINYNGWFVGNVADIAIVGAAVLVAVLALIGLEIDGRRVSSTDSAEPVAVDGDDTLLSEEPDVDDDEFTPLVAPAAGGDDDVDLARWVSDGRPAAQHETSLDDATEVSPERPADPLPPEPLPAGPATPDGAADEPTHPPMERPRWRSRRDMRTATSDDG
ncbi:signal peptidase II [Georgenia sunbinii]|uniref:signal peptidase II n=1 Tax=Georgenia sunbinii TaxID=3117728 RepID=UPI002F26BEAC